MTMAPWTKVVPLDSLTLPAAIPFIRHELNAGIAAAIISVNRFYEVLPFQRVSGDVGETYYQDCRNEVSEISSAAKTLGRAYVQDITKTFYHYPTTNVKSKSLNFQLMNALLTQVNAPDFFMAHQTLIRSIYALHREAETDMQKWPLSHGMTVPTYKDVPVFRNDFIDEGHLILGRFDDGTKTRGVSGLIPDQGFISATSIRTGWHLTFTGDLAVFADDAVAGLTNVKPY